MEGTPLHFPQWVDLPDHVTELILENIPLPDYIRFAAVCRKWRSIQKDHRLRHSPHPPPMGPLSLPWLITCDLDLRTGLECYSPLEKKLHRLRFPTTQGRALCMASSHGWLLMIDYDPFDIDKPILPSSRSPFLFNPLTRSFVLLPMLPIAAGDLCFGALSSPPYDPDCTILLVGGGSRVFTCRSNHPGDGWSRLMDTDERIDSAVHRDGKFYCISREGSLYVIDHVLSTPKVLRLSMDVSALKLHDAYRCHLVEFGGELILIVELYRLEGFQVLKADLSGEKWVNKMDLLGDHVLFLNANCCSLPLLASDVGCKKNCIYYTEGHGYCTWRVFDLDARNWIHEKEVMHERFIFYSGRWFLPTLA